MSRYIQTGIFPYLVYYKNKETFHDPVYENRVTFPLMYEDKDPFLILEYEDRGTFIFRGVLRLGHFFLSLRIKTHFTAKLSRKRK